MNKKLVAVAVAEEVAAVEPLLVTHNTRGEVEGVKYDRINVVLVNAIKEQQAQIDKLRRDLVDTRASLRQVQALGRLGGDRMGERHCHVRRVHRLRDGGRDDRCRRR